MRRLALYLSSKIAALILLAAMIVCSAAGISQHVIKSSSGIDAGNCSSICSSHGQHVAINSQTQYDDDENEPVPPSVNWNSSSAGYVLVFLAPVGVAFWILTRQRLFILSTRMRF